MRVPAKISDVQAVSALDKTHRTGPTVSSHHRLGLGKPRPSLGSFATLHQQENLSGLGLRDCNRKTPGASQDFDQLSVGQFS